MSDVTTPIRIAGLISGGGRTLLNLADAIDRGQLNATIALVVSSRAEASGVQRLRDRGYEVKIASPASLGSMNAVHDAITTWLDEASIDLVCLAGYLRWLKIEPRYRGRVMNIHPALLPRFGGPGMYGLHVHRAVLQAGETVSGCTVHFVDEEYDHGPVILQRECPVLPDDNPETLAARVFEQECRAYPEAVRLFAEGRLKIHGDRVEILPARNPNPAGEPARPRDV